MQPPRRQWKLRSGDVYIWSFLAFVAIVSFLILYHNISLTDPVTQSSSSTKAPSGGRIK